MYSLALKYADVWFWIDWSNVVNKWTVGTIRINFLCSTTGLLGIRLSSLSWWQGRPLWTRQGREGRPAEECGCVQPLGVKQNQAFLMEVFILCSAVWSILDASASVIASGRKPNTFRAEMLTHCQQLWMCWMEMEPMAQFNGDWSENLLITASIRYIISKSPQNSLHPRALVKATMEVWPHSGFPIMQHYSSLYTLLLRHMTNIGCSI